MKITRFVLLAAALVVTGCAPDITDTEFFREHPLQAPAGDVISITEGQFGDITFRILAADSLHFGHSSFLVEAERNGEVLDNGSLTVRTRWVTDSRLLPMPATSTISSVDEDGRYLSKAYFLQPVAETGIWEMSIDFDIGGSQGTLDL
ncbi:MAG: hypothetical protein HKN43_00355, partial [Rhodothermales bacterium]|nr:hypothetical protein [Rhodothermales bacterium]